MEASESHYAQDMSTAHEFYVHASAPPLEASDLYPGSYSFATTATITDNNTFATSKDLMYPQLYFDCNSSSSSVAQNTEEILYNTPSIQAQPQQYYPTIESTKNTNNIGNGSIVNENAQVEAEADMYAYQVARKEAERRLREKPSQFYATNDRDFIDKKISKRRLRAARAPSKVYNQLQEEEEEEEAESDEDDNKPYDPYTSSKPITSVITSVIKSKVKGIKSVFQKINEALLVPDEDNVNDDTAVQHTSNTSSGLWPKNIEKSEKTTPHHSSSSSFSTVKKNTSALVKNDLENKTSLNLYRDLGCSSLREALEKKINLHYIRKCNLDPISVSMERINVTEFQKYGLSFYDVNRTLNITWAQLLHDGLNKNIMTRKNRWFDVNSLAYCIATQRADLVQDLGFGIEDIFRLKCADVEISQLDINMDRLIEMGLNRAEFLALPWFLETMCDLLGLTKKHLCEDLKLLPKDFQFLMQNRRWTINTMMEQLEFTREELNAMHLLPDLHRAENYWAYVAAEAEKEQKLRELEEQKKRMVESNVRKIKDGDYYDEDGEEEYESNSTDSENIEEEKEKGKEKMQQQNVDDDDYIRFV